MGLLSIAKIPHAATYRYHCYVGGIASPPSATFSNHNGLGVSAEVDLTYLSLGRWKATSYDFSTL